MVAMLLVESATFIRHERRAHIATSGEGFSSDLQKVDTDLQSNVTNLLRALHRGSITRIGISRSGHGESGLRTTEALGQGTLTRPHGGPGGEGTTRNTELRVSSMMQALTQALHKSLQNSRVYPHPKL